MKLNDYLYGIKTIKFILTFFSNASSRFRFAVFLIAVIIIKTTYLFEF